MSKSSAKRKNKRRGTRTRSNSGTTAPLLADVEAREDVEAHDVPSGQVVVAADRQWAVYDEGLLDRARQQWQAGDWASLTRLDAEALERHPQREKLALLAAIGHLQKGAIASARKGIRQALDWGCEKKVVAQLLTASVYNTLAVASILRDDDHRALAHFRNAIAIGTPGTDGRMLANSRIDQSKMELGLAQTGTISRYSAPGTMPPLSPGESPHGAPNDAIGISSYRGHELKVIAVNHELRGACTIGDWDRLSRLDNAELRLDRSRAELALLAALGHQQMARMDDAQRCMCLATEWGMGIDTVRRILAAGVRNTLALANVTIRDYDAAGRNFLTSLTWMGLSSDSRALLARVRHQVAGMENVDRQAVVEIASKIKKPDYIKD